MKNSTCYCLTYSTLNIYPSSHTSDYGNSGGISTRIHYVFTVVESKIDSSILCSKLDLKQTSTQRRELFSPDAIFSDTHSHRARKANLVSHSSAAMPPILLPPPPAGIQTPTDDWTDDPSFDLTLSPSLATVPLHSSPTSSSSSSSRKQTHSRSHSHSSTSSRGSSGIIASPLRHAHIPKLDIGNTRLKSEAEGEKEEMEDGFDYLPDDIPEDDGFEKRGTDKRLSIQSGSSVRSGKVSGMGTMKGKPPALESGLEGFDFPDDLEIDDDEDGDENQGGTIKLPTSTTIKSTKKGMGTISLSGTIIGVGPKGVGTITRLGSSSTPSASSSKLSLGGSKTQFSEVDDFEGFDDDLANIPTLPSSKSLSMNSNSSTGLMLPPLNRLIAPANALDDLDFDFDDELDAIGEDEDQATLKAGATIKALLPPPRTKPSSSSSSITPKPTSRQSMTTSLPPPEDESEMDLVLPLSMTNLTLANASTRPPHSSSSTKHLKPRASTSTIQSDWDSPSSGSGPGSASKHIWDDSPWGKQRPRASETSGTSTSISDHLGTPVRKGRTVEVEVEGEEEGEEMMLGLVLPESGFFEGRREGELNRILDKKRKPTDAFVSPPHEGGVGGRSWGRSRGEGNRTILLDESMEDGLLFEEEELTGHRLRQQKKVRGLNAGGGPGGTIKRGTVIGKEGSGGGGGGGRGSSAAGSWEKAREAGWGRNAPLRSSTPRDRERERSTGGLGLAGVGGGVSVGHRSHSATASGIPGATGNHIGKPLSSSNRDFSSASAMAGFTSRTTSTADRERDTNSQVIRTRTQSMAPPPIPSIPSTPSSRLLRHQKSHYQIPLPPSPSPTQSIHRKQSLASLQDALSSHPVPDLPPPPSSSSTPQKERYHNSTSRLTMGTSSSRAKVRPPISSIFPRSEMTQAYTSHSASSSTSSISGLTRGPPDPRRSTQVHVQSQMVVPLGGKRRGGLEGKKRTWGDGTELEGIEDLEVDEPSSQIPRSGSGGAGGNGIGLGKPSLTRKGEFC